MIMKNENGSKEDVGFKVGKTKGRKEKETYTSSLHNRRDL